MQRGRGGERGRWRARGRGGDRGRWRGKGRGGDGGTEPHDPAAVVSAAAQDPASVASAAAQDPAAVASAAAQDPAAVASAAAQTSHIYGPFIFGVTAEMLGLPTVGASPPQHSSPQEPPAPEEILMTDLLQYLRKYHSADAKRMFTEKTFKLEIEFRLFKKRGKQLAYGICNGYKDLKDSINATFKIFLTEHFQPASLVDVEADLVFNGMPKSIESFKDYVNRHRSSSKLFVPSEFEHEVADMAPGPQKMLRKLLSKVLNKHKDKYCWRGKWSVEDWEVVDDEDLQFEVEADCERFKARKDSQKDLVKIGKEVLTLFVLEVAGGQAGGAGNQAGGHAASRGQGNQALGAGGNQAGGHTAAGGSQGNQAGGQAAVGGAGGNQVGGHAASRGQGNQAGGAPRPTKKMLYPPYLQHLINQLTNTSARMMMNGRYMLDEAYYGWYYSFLLYHPCLLSSKARKSLLKGLHELCVNLQYWRRSKWHEIFTRGFKRWNFLAGGFGRFKLHPMLTEVFWGTNSRSARSAVHGTPSPSPAPSPSSATAAQPAASPSPSPTQPAVHGTPAQPAASPSPSPTQPAVHGTPAQPAASPAAASSIVAPNHGKKMPYKNTVGDLLKFMHDALRHIYDFTTAAQDGKNHVQYIQDSDEPERFMADMYPHFFPNLLMWIFEMEVMEGEALEYWNMFKDHWKID